MNDDTVMTLTAQIIAAHVSHNPTEQSALPGLIEMVRRSLQGTQTNPAEPTKIEKKETSVETQKPAVPIKRSVTPTHIICLEDGMQMKMMKRYLMINYNLTPEQYRAKWGLPADYPMVAPAYAERRSELAKKSGLGRAPKFRSKLMEAARAAQKTERSAVSV
ncbi:unnamed protein product [Sphagnum tenellum]